MKINKAFQAFLYSLTCQLLISFVQAIIKLMQVSVAQLMTYRAIAILLINYSSLKYIRKLDVTYFPPKKHLQFLIVGSLMNSVGNQLNFFSLKQIPIEISNICFMTQILWCQLLAFLIYKRPLSWIRIRNILICLSGIILIIQPSFLFDKGTNQHANNYMFGVSLALLGSVTSALGMLISSQIGLDVEKSTQVQYFQFCHMLWGSFIMILFKFDSPNVYKFNNIVVIIFIAVLTYIANFAQFTALTIENAEKISVVTCVTPVMGLIYDIFLFNHYPDKYSLLGSAIVLGGTLSTIFDNIKQRS